MNIEDRLQRIDERYRELNNILSDPDIYDNPSRYAELSKEHSTLAVLVEDYGQWQKLKKNLGDNKELIALDPGSELAEMAREENNELKERMEQLQEEIKIKLVPKDPEDSRNAIVEIRAGTGGDEAAIFAGDLFEMYRRYADEQGWKLELLSLSEAPKGGFKEIVFQ
ncbi:MAG TPA: PCRF domain-containing protein, partial [Balneolales bacterium]|nr:PCRF domain-containing protein [Balneolales bacterium]